MPSTKLNRLRRLWAGIHTFRAGLGGSHDTGVARFASFQKAESVAGLLAGAGSIAVAVPGTVTSVTPASALLLLPIATLIGYGALILAGYLRKGQTEPPLTLHQRHVIRRRIVAWGAIIIIALAIPLDWVWPVFLSGWIGIAYAVRQMQHQRRP